MNEFGESIVKFKRVRNERFTPPDVSMYAGEYLSSELNTRYNLVVKEETLVLQRTPYDVPKPIHPFTENTFLYESGELRLQFKNGLAKGFILHAGRVTNIKFRKVT